jgi:rubredoxin
LYLCDDTITIYQQHSRGINNIPVSGIWNRIRNNSSLNVTPVSTSWTTTGVNGDYIQVTQTYNFGNITINTNSFRFSMGYDVIDLRTGDIYYESTTDHMLPFNTVTNMPMAYISNTWDQYLKPIQTLSVTTNKFRSLSYWSINDILGNDFNPFTWLIDYVKMFRLYFDIDYVTKTITLKKGYFDTVTYKQAVVDYSKGVVIEPVIDKYNMVDFGYSHNDSVKGSLFKKSWGVEYGDLNISTGLDINNDKLSLNPNKDQSVFIPTILDTLYYNNLNSSSVIKTGNMLGTNKVINTLDKDGKIQYFPFFAFRLENKSDTFIYLSDDTPLQKSEGKYYYLEHRLLSNGWEDEEETIEDNTTVYYGKKLSSLPQFDNCISVNEGNVWKCTVCGYETEGSEAPSTCPNCGSALSFISLPKIILYWNTFNVPKEVFNGYLPYNLGSTAIYDQRWKNYLSEIFNVHNNKVTCYVKMSYPEFINFKFNQLFVIDNVTFLVNKIIDFNPNNPGPTKVELIEISDPGNLQ